MAVPVPAAVPPVAAPAEAVDPTTEFVDLKDVTTVGRVCGDARLPATPVQSSPDYAEQRMAVATQAAVRKAALERIYIATVPSDRFQFGDYDVDAGKLSVTTQGGFHTLRGGLHAWSLDADPLEATVAVAAAKEALAARKKGLLALRVYMHLDADPDDEGADGIGAEPCASRPGTQAYVMAVSWLGAELLDGRSGKSLATFTTEKGRQTAQLALRLLGETALRISPPKGAGDSVGTLMSAFEARRAALEACYQQHGHHAEGGLVVGLDVGKQGAVERVRVDVASLESDALSRCVVDEVKGANFVAKAAAGAHVTVPLIWSRD